MNFINNKLYNIKKIFFNNYVIFPFNYKYYNTAKNNIKFILENHKDLNDYNFIYEYRIKNIFKIFKKILNKRLPYDIFGIRIIYNNTKNFNDTESAYLIKNIIEEKYNVIDRYYDDYIHNPKMNNYQSLHIYILYYILIEIQIRNINMHYIAVNGTASDWNY